VGDDIRIDKAAAGWLDRLIERVHEAQVHEVISFNTPNPDRIPGEVMTDHQRMEAFEARCFEHDDGLPPELDRSGWR